MIPAAQALIAELEAETPATRRVLERVPDDRLAWQPHQKSLSLGQLAQHVALIPGNMAKRAAAEGMEVGAGTPAYPAAASAAELLPTLDASLSAARDFLAGLDEASAHATWTMRAGDRVLFAVPRLAMLRRMMFNHWYHHRGQLAVYLRLLDVPVPIIYGRTADESPVPPPTA